MNKKNQIKENNLLIFIVFSLIVLISLILTSGQVSAAKADQYRYQNYTCENFTDDVLWTILSGPSKADFNNYYFNWTPGNICPGTKNCDITSIYTNTRYASVYTGTLPVGSGLIQIANKSQSPMPIGTSAPDEPPPAAWSSIRYAAYLNSSLPPGEVLGPRWECGSEPTAQPNNTCSIAGKGYNIITNYSVRMMAGSTTANTKALFDTFALRYPWCWTPIISDALVSSESGAWDTTQFSFKINVTNPTATTNVSLWTRTAGGAWTFASLQTCVNCSYQNLTFLKSFTSGDIGNKEFKFNATDSQGYGVQAGNPSTIGTTTNECLDTGNDCAFIITDVVVSSAAPTLQYETVNGVTSGATEGWGKPNWVFSVNVSNPAGGQEISL